ncbi:hypothetical protein H5410_059785 [Solanum commersonii]|uniref:Uncharacterized protein n=1 Tax=Solanum commersonii TaxID=4109 RepID=A0A9J5W3B1_SOLCO|nr:hypothetical protein H5410_059785 [Solanum commersonii]
MTNKGDINASSTTNVRQDGGKKQRKGRKPLKSNEELLLDPTPSEALTSHSFSTTEASGNKCDEKPTKWIARVDTVRKDVEILGKRLNKADDNDLVSKRFTRACKIVKDS